jgi:hypothetical protein
MTMNALNPRPAGPSSSPSSGSVFVPPPITRLEDTGLAQLWLQDLALKILYFQGYLSGFKIAEEIALPFAGVTDQILESLKREKLVEVKSSSMGLGEGSYQYAITGAGTDHAREALDRSQYAGPAPVPIEIYNTSIKKQSQHRVVVTQRHMRQLLSQLVLSNATFEQLGPALNSGTSIFLYGPPGNGKTSVARAFGSMVLQQDMYIPYALFVDGQVIKLYDSVNHQRAPDEDSTASGTGSLRSGGRRDPRWVHIRRPFIVVGGELTLQGLDLVFDDTHKYYEAPFQVKANGGILLIDDFGRQQVRPRDLLNRWIVPLENRVDFLTLHTGRKIEIPSMCWSSFQPTCRRAIWWTRPSCAACVTRLRSATLPTKTSVQFSNVWPRPKGCSTTIRAWPTSCRNGTSNAIANCALRIRAICAIRSSISPSTAAWPQP